MRRILPVLILSLYAQAASALTIATGPAAVVIFKSPRTSRMSRRRRALIFAFLETKGHPKWQSSIIRTYFPHRGYEPTNQMIQIFNLLDKQGYKVIKK